VYGDQAHRINEVGGTGGGRGGNLILKKNATEKGGPLSGKKSKLGGRGKVSFFVKFTKVIKAAWDNS